ncbi:hypothetical protein Vafri_4113, partial [Volvox africanus]
MYESSSPSISRSGRFASLFAATMLAPSDAAAKLILRPSSSSSSRWPPLIWDPAAAAMPPCAAAPDGPVPPLKRLASKTPGPLSPTSPETRRPSTSPPGRTPTVACPSKITSS